MILLRRSTAIALFILFTGAILAIGIYAYITLSADLKTTAETILYISLCGVALLIVAFIAVAGRTMSLFREIDRLIELNKQGDFSPELSMKKLGPIGERITLLYYSLNALNEKKTLKISALSDFADFLVENITVPLVATDVQGYIRYVSRNLTERADQPRADLISRNVEEVFPDVPFRDLILEVDKSGSPVEFNELKSPLTLIGIRNRRNELSYIIWLFEGTAHLPERMPRGERGRSRGARPRGDRLARLFRRRSARVRHE
jgi:PAS domain-containing protein